MGTTPDQHPNALGYDDWYGFLSGGRYYYPNDHPNYKGKYLKKTTPWDMRKVHHTLPIMHNYEVLDWDQYITRELTDYSLKFINDQKENPFFLFVSYNAPHLELEAPEETIKMFPPENMTKVPGVSQRSRSIYAAMTYEMDLGIGRIIKQLEDQNLLDNTLIWFLSDNGGMSRTSDNRPLKGAKGALYEGGLRVPFIAHWPKVIQPGTVVDHPVTSLDIGATAVALSGGDLSSTQLDGADLTKNFTGADAPHEELYWSWSYHQDQSPEKGVYLKNGFKLIIGKQLQLYNLNEDLSEKNNLADDMSDLAAQYHERWRTLNQASSKPIFGDTQSGKYAYQYANYEWLKGTPHYKADVDPLDY